MSAAVGGLLLAASPLAPTPAGAEPPPGPPSVPGLYGADGRTPRPEPRTRQEMAQRLGEMQQANTYTADPDMIGADGTARVSKAGDLETDCKKEFPIPGTSDHSVQDGWVRDHYAWCTRQQMTLKYSDKPLDIAYFTLTILGVGSKNSRQATFTVRLSDWVHPPGSGPEWAEVPLSVQLACSTVNTGGNCKPSGTVLRPVAQWKIQPEATFTLSSDNAGEAVEKVVLGRFTFTLSWPGAPTPHSYANYARFDSAQYMRKGSQKGAIFNAVVPSWPLDGKEPRIRESVKHISNACKRPDTTDPKVSYPKVIAGCSRTNIIHRLKHDMTRRRANRADAVAVCRAKDPNYPSKGLSCDEYPFSCTYEGAAQPKYDRLVKYGMFSARAITAVDNSTSGSMLGAWYASDRILDFRSAASWTDPTDGKTKQIQDPFYVRIENDPNTAASLGRLIDRLHLADKAADDPDPLDCNSE
ncbi:MULTISPECIES: NucA/NucB deoxyribonuclease domain-containing protein [Actinomadura]|uniref:NucA/NucB deoxyribonuclease domain-containing protein n=2 Tax=Actinomadura yumaensis TaxID=111807 RepID=A0ABW2CR32_9ACTN|nr:NucA/NucB deoxyribonuclease domain-containing protein [Actinomadura sp. J1-007]